MDVADIGQVDLWLAAVGEASLEDEAQITGGDSGSRVDLGAGSAVHDQAIRGWEWHRRAVVTHDDLVESFQHQLEGKRR